MRISQCPCGRGLRTGTARCQACRIEQILSAKVVRLEDVRRLTPPQRAILKRRRRVS